MALYYNKKNNMAISVDTVYQRVQSILNKENRGYLTPQEFNLFANQAQLEIFEQYFFDLNQYERLPKKDTEYSNLVKTINERISKFKTSATLTFTTPYFSMPSDMHKLGTVIYNSTTPVEEIDQKNLLEYTLSPLTAPSTTNPVYIQNIQTTSSVWSIVVYPSSIDGTTGQVITATYIRKPVDASWASKTIVGNALYDASNSTNFELHPSEEETLVMRILELAGVVIEKENLQQSIMIDKANTKQEQNR